MSEFTVNELERVGFLVREAGTRDQSDPQLVLSNIRRWEDSAGVSVPPVLVEWLLVCNGLRVASGSLFGIGTRKAEIDIRGVLTLFSSWCQKRWIPVADDGCGDYFILAPQGSRHVVGFVDTASDSDAIAYIVSSCLQTFVRCFLEENAEPKGWPFERAVTLEMDPGLAQVVTDWPMPWDV